MAGDRESGVSVMKMDEGLDTGAVALSERVAIGPDMTSGELSAILMEHGAGVLAESVNAIARGDLRTFKQNAALACPAPKLKKEEGKIDFTRPAIEVYNRIRAFTPVPGAFAFFNGKRVQITKAALSGQAEKAKPGSVVSAGASGIRVGAGSGIVTLLMLKPENKKEMAAKDFINGFHVRQNDLFSD
jgi:methionyl-tRNA formyltransferase